MSPTRREFVKQTSVASLAAVVPYVWTSSYARARDANGKPTVAAIGLGGSRSVHKRGAYIGKRAAEFGQMIACCDVDDLHSGEFNEAMGGKLKVYRDYRALLDKEKPDVVTIGTPDHWHVPIAIAAMYAGCDVYCEKPLTLTIDEGKIIRRVVAETGRVFQVGTQQRSECEGMFLKAIAMIHAGLLGENVKASVAIEKAPTGGPFETAEPPRDIDWDFWLGPAPKAEYSDDRRREFRWFFDYSGGKMTDWGAHHIDIAQWALGKQDTGPVKVRGTGKFTPAVPEKFDWAAYFDGRATLPSAYNTATEFSIDLEFADGGVINVRDIHRSGEGDAKIEFYNGILFEGDAGRIFVNRGRLTGKPVEQLTQADNEKLDRAVAKLYKGKTPGDHMKNFFDCLEDRSQPVSDVGTHHRTMTSCHLCNIALMLGRELHWDPAAETFIADKKATALMSRKRRTGYDIG